YALQWSDPVVQAPGEARSNHRVFTELAKAMGFNEPELGVGEEDLVRSVVKDVDRVKQAGYTPLPRPVPFVDPGLPLILISPASDKAITSQLFELLPGKSARVAVAPAEAALRGLRAGDR